MLVEAKLLKKALDGELWDLFQIGFDPKILRPPYDTAFSRLIEFYQRHNELPGIRRLQSMCADIGGVTVAAANQCKSKASVYWDQLLNGYLGEDIANALETVVQEHNKQARPPREFLSFALLRMRQLEAKYQIATSQSSSPADLAEQLWSEFTMTEAGQMPGIPIEPNFRLFIDSFVKWRPGNITTVVSRSGIGKTWLCLIQCLYAAVCGFKSLIASMEMTDLEIDRRLAALAAMVNFDRVVKGTLNSVPEQRAMFAKIVSDQRANKGYWSNIRYMSPTAITDIASVEAQADLFGAHVVMADAFYDFPEDSENMKGYEKINENLKAVRRVSLSSKRHWFLTAQFNKSALGTYSADEFAVGGTDKFNHISNNVIYMIQRKRDRTNRQIIFKIGKGRDAAPHLPWLHYWNFFEMKWSPIAVHTESNKIDKKHRGKQL
jgi:hypothetical protein